MRARIGLRAIRHRALFAWKSDASPLAAVAIPAFSSGVSPTRRITGTPNEGSALSGAVNFAASSLAGLQEVTGLPWWAAIGVSTWSLRLALLPFAVKQSQASQALSSLGSLVTKAREDRSADAGPVSVVELKQVVRKWDDARRSSGAPSPLWVISPLAIQLPVFVATMAATRQVCLSGLPGMDKGGLLWFQDLSLAAFDLPTLTAPMGPLGAILPAAAVLLFFGNVQQISGSAVGRSPSTVLARYKLLLEWLTVPMLVVALQLPQGCLVYWVASNAFTAVQGRTIRSGWFELGPSPAAVGGEGRGSEMSTRSTLLKRAAEIEGRGAGSQPIALSSDEVASLDYESVISLARRFGGKKDWTQAHVLFSLAATKATDSGGAAEPLFWAGVASSNLGRDGDAIRTFEMALRSDSKHLQALMSLASVLIKVGRRSEALAYLERAAQIDPKVKDALDRAQQEDSAGEKP